MKINPIILEELQKKHNHITTSQVEQLGFSRTLLLKYVSNGLLERVGHGVYTLPDTIVDDMYLLQQCSDKIIFSHDTALFLNGLSDRTPFIHSVTIPSNSSLSQNTSDNCICYYIKPELHQLGVIQKNTTLGNTVYCYDMERTICDLFRSRNRCDEETVISAIKNYADYKGKDLNRLFEYASRFRTYKILKNYMEVLL